MELIVAIFMIAGGMVLAASVLAAFSVAGSLRPRLTAPLSGVPQRDRIAGSVLYSLLLLGGESRETASGRVRASGRGFAQLSEEVVDVSSWAEMFARVASEEQREWLLERAVELVSDRSGAVPLRQYSGLLDLSFGLGFQTSALAQLRGKYHFEYIDPAGGSPGASEKSAGREVARERQSSRGTELLRILQVEGPASRQLIISAYRRLAAQHHPDRFHGRSQGEKESANARFIEITRAYETLMARYRD